MRELLRRLGGATPATVRVIVLIALSVSMMLIDHRSQQLEKLRNILQTAVYPIMYVSTIPREMIQGLTGSMERSENLQSDNESLRQENLLLRSRLEKLHSHCGRKIYCCAAAWKNYIHWKQTIADSSACLGNRIKSQNGCCWLNL